jgi:hypothetical protein
MMVLEVKPLQVWVAYNKDGKPLRRIKILAKHPEREDSWIYEELNGGIFKTEIGRLGIFPEFNLRLAGYKVEE